MKPSKLLGANERERIEAAVREAEAGTAGEIVVTVVRECDEYGAAGWRLGVLLAALAAPGLLIGLPSTPLLAILAAQALALAAGHALGRVESIRRLFVAEEQLQANAEREALRAFAQHGVRKTRRGTGILIFVALFEHRVVVLGDEAVNRALDPDESWQEVVDRVLAGIRDGRAADGLVAAIRRCGDILSHPLPAGPDDRDEIPHGLIIEE
jgi:putative membrane protein